jgi:hypothetical protein
MMQARWVRETAVAGALALAVLLAGAPMPAQAQEDDSVEQNTIWNLERRVWGSIVRGLGLRDPNTPVIDYRERSPLVVPPSADLPAPQPKATPKNAAWPNDPDVAKARKAAEAKKRLNAGRDMSRVVDNQGNPITPDQLNRPGAVPAQSNRSNAPASGTDIDGKPVAPSELGYFGGLFSGRAWGFGTGFGGYKDETGTFTNEPTRDQLTQPPPGYQTPSAAHPYGVTRRVERTAPQQFDPARGAGQ